MSGSGEGVIEKSKSHSFNYPYEYHQLSLSVLLFILPLKNSLLFHFSSKMQERTVLFTFTWLNLLVKYM